MAWKVGEVNRDSCILEGVESSPGGLWAHKSKPNVGKVVSFCLEEGQTLLLTEKKEGLPWSWRESFL